MNKKSRPATSRKPGENQNVARKLEEKQFVVRPDTDESPDITHPDNALIDKEQHSIDEASEDSFPASDPPARNVSKV